MPKLVFAGTLILHFRGFNLVTNGKEIAVRYNLTRISPDPQDFTMIKFKNQACVANWFTLIEVIISLGVLV